MSTTQEFTRLTSRLASVHGPAAQSALVYRRQVLARRRRMLAVLAATAVITLVAAVAWGSIPLLIVHVVVDAALIAYVAMLLQIKQRQQAAEKVIDIRTAAPAAEQSDVQILASS